MTYIFNDGLRPGGRWPKLWLAKNNKLRKFRGTNIPGYCVIVRETFEKRGKWSNTSYEIELAKGVRPIYMLPPLHGEWGEHFSSWADVSLEMGISVEKARSLVRLEYPKTFRRLEAIDIFGIEQEKSGAGTEIVTISFGSPTNRQIAEGYWDTPKSGYTADGAIEVIVAPNNGPDKWYQPIVLAPDGAQIISAKRSPGRHGGYVTVEVAVPVKG